MRVINIIILVTLQFRSLTEFFCVYRHKICIRNRTTACGNVYPLVLKHTRDTVTDALIFERLVFTEIRLVIHPVYRAIFILLYPESEIFVVYRITAHIVDDPFFHIAVHGARHIRVKNTASHCHDKKYCQKSLIVSGSFQL